MSSWMELLERAEPRDHVVQLYGRDDQLLAGHVALYLAEGLRRGDGLLVIATPAHVHSILLLLEEKGTDPAAATREGRLVVLDAQTTLARFMDGGAPSWELFEEVVGGTIRELRSRIGHGGMRAFGEMVGLLWAAGEKSAVLELEALWNRLLETHAISVYCAYPIDLFHGDCEDPSLSALIASHGHAFAAPRTLFSSPCRSANAGRALEAARSAAG